MTHRFPSPLLILEASTSAGSVALIVDDVVVADRSVTMGPSRDDALLPAIAGVLSDAQMSPREVVAIACGGGPGSFTSLRIAASLAKGLAVAAGAPLFAVPSLLLAAAALKGSPGQYLLHGDALRGERYVVRVAIEQDDVIAMSSVTRMALDDVTALAEHEGAQLVVVGNGGGDDLQRTLVLQPHARNVVLLDAMWRTFGPVSLEEWEPDYGRLAEAQVKWESTHGRVLPVN